MTAEPLLRYTLGGAGTAGPGSRREDGRAMRSGGALPELVRERRGEVLAAWRALVAGGAEERGLERWLEALLERLLDDDATEAPAGEALRLRAVQELAPSRAVLPVLLLKQALRAVLDPASLDRSQWAEWLELESRVDALALRAFDGYVACRERVHEVRAAELRRRTDRVLRVLTTSAGRGGNGAGE